MDRMKRLFEPAPVYTPVHTDQDEQEGEDLSSSQTLSQLSEPPFQWLEYFIFLLLGVAMLWAWNMFLAAAPYFQSRFKTSPWILNHFQAAEISVSCVVNLLSMLVLSKMQKNASYPKRISWALIINIVTFTVLALSTFVTLSATAYFTFLLVAIFFASLSTGLIQNGLFSFSSGFGRSEYTQAIMTGQGVAGVLPPLTQIISVLITNGSRGETNEDINTDTLTETSTAAFIYFITATVISLLALLAFFYLLRRKAHSEALWSAHTTTVHGTTEGDALSSPRFESAASKHTTGLYALFRKMPSLSAAVFLTFAITMMGFPVFTAYISSVNNISSTLFIPLGFLVWNLGDFTGRLVTLFPRLSLTHYPFALLCIAGARLVFIPFYFLCNIKGRGATIQSDFFYLVVVQFLFGLSNGYVGSEGMMGAGQWVAPDEREAAGGFMGLVLVAGLTAGSLLSFAFGNV